MIRTEKQLRTTRRKYQEAIDAAGQVEESDATGYLAFAEKLKQEIDEYLAIREGRIKFFSIDEVDNLANGLIKARIARRLTQAALAERLGVSEQMVQRDEQGAYERASLSRLAEVADVLGYRLVGELIPEEAMRSGTFTFRIAPLHDISVSSADVISSSQSTLVSNLVGEAGGDAESVTGARRLA
jgi:transcriptional regulator with XRE-family HTH domain